MINALFAEFGVCLLFSVGSIMTKLWAGRLKNLCLIALHKLVLQGTVCFTTAFCHLLASVRLKPYTHSSGELRTLKNFVNLSFR